MYVEPSRPDVPIAGTSPATDPADFAAASDPRARPAPRPRGQLPAGVPRNLDDFQLVTDAVANGAGGNWQRLVWAPAMQMDVERVMFAHWFSLLQILAKQTAHLRNVGLDQVLRFFSQQAWPEYQRVADAGLQVVSGMVRQRPSELKQAYFQRDTPDLLITHGMTQTAVSELQTQQQLQQCQASLAKCKTEVDAARRTLIARASELRNTYAPGSTVLVEPSNDARLDAVVQWYSQVYGMVVSSIEAARDTLVARGVQERTSALEQEVARLERGKAVAGERERNYMQRHGDAVRELDAARLEVERLSRNLEMAEKAAADFKAKNDRLEPELGDCRRDLSEVKNINKRLNSENNELKRANEALKRELKEHKSRADGLKSQLDTANAQNTSLTDEVRRLKDAKADLKRRNAELENRVSDCESRLRNQLGDLQSTLTRLATARGADEAALKANLDDMGRKLIEFGRQNALLSGDVGTLGGIKDAIRSSGSELANALTGAVRRVEDHLAYSERRSLEVIQQMQEETARRLQVFLEQQTQLGRLDVNELKTLIDATRRKAIEVVRGAEETRAKQLKALENKVDGLVQGVQQEQDTRLARVDNIVRQLDNLRQTNTALADRTEISAREIDRLTGMMERLETGQHREAGYAGGVLTVFARRLYNYVRPRIIQMAQTEITNDTELFNARTHFYHDLGVVSVLMELQNNYGVDVGAINLKDYFKRVAERVVVSQTAQYEGPYMIAGQTYEVAVRTVISQTFEGNFIRQMEGVIYGTQPPGQASAAAAAAAAAAASPYPTAPPTLPGPGSTTPKRPHGSAGPGSPEPPAQKLMTSAQGSSSTSSSTSLSTYSQTPGSSSTSLSSTSGPSSSLYPFNQASPTLSDITALVFADDDD